ncbi:hypothetical protein HMPREF0201_04497 [Cedecea davisae DSM 4568]|uniref:Uncharacterized protein n=1 Tax=Cedecea davisae DSM 4568 TaxID=566551 RepID=S3JI73_9ENTR|nr:hypothetical protein HMPREF0201_04497 [Cedecea davisae DSM 4568]
MAPGTGLVCNRLWHSFHLCRFSVPWGLVISNIKINGLKPVYTWKKKNFDLRQREGINSFNSGPL